MPHAMRKGYGQLLIDFSMRDLIGFFFSSQKCLFATFSFTGYMLTKEEASVGTPERPLSHLGIRTMAIFNRVLSPFLHQAWWPILHIGSGKF